jgi:hypothetical protein
MTLSRCPQCNEELSRIEQLDGKCINCGKDFDKAFSAAHGEPEDSPYHASASIKEPLNLRQKESVALLIAFLVTLATPFGLPYSCFIGVMKGDTICAAPGCTAEAAKRVEFSGGVSRGYCDEHVHDAATSLANKQLAFPYALCVIGLLFVIFFFYSFGEAYTGKSRSAKRPGDKPSDPFRFFLWLTLIGIFGVNAAFWALTRYLC